MSYTLIPLNATILDQSTSDKIVALGTGLEIEADIMAVCRKLCVRNETHGSEITFLA